MATRTEQGGNSDQDRYIRVPSVDEQGNPIIITIEKDPKGGPGKVVFTEPDPSRQKKN